MAEDLVEPVVKEILPFTYSEIAAKVKQILLSKGLTDIQYPGSNISQIADIMTYLVHTLNTNTAINLQEVILQLATKRMNVLFGGRQLGYEAVQRTSYIYEVDITINRNNDLTDSDLFNITIPRFTIFESDGNKYYYMGQDIYIQDITNLNRFEKGFTLQIKEGDLLRYTDNELLNFRASIETEGNVTKTKQNYLIPFNNVEDNGIELWLTYIDDNGTNVQKEYWTKHKQFLIDSSFAVTKRKFVTLQNIFLQMPSVFFEIGGYGNPVKLNTLIQANVLLSKGSEGISKGTFTLKDATLAKELSVGYNKIIHTGTEVESMESIKENAPIFHNSANRAVTSLDYVAITQRHEAVDKSIVWGVEDEYRQESSQATVLFSFLPERTKREFASTELDSDSNKVSEDDAQHLQYDLQNMPRRPQIDYLPNPDTVLPPRPEPTVPKFQYRPPNYIKKPNGYDTFSELTPVLTPPDPVGEKPLIPIFEERNKWMEDGTSKGNDTGVALPILPDDWVEIPVLNYPAWSDLSGSDNYGQDGLQQIQTADFINMQNEYKRTIFNYENDTNTGFKNNIQLWYDSLTINRDTIPNSVGGSWNSTDPDPLNPLGDELPGSYYIEWLKKPEVRTYFDWQVADYKYRVDLEAYENYQSQLAQYKEYKDYLNTPEGSAYTNGYKNTLSSEENKADNAYNEYLVDTEIYDVNKIDIESIVYNWYLTREEVYETADTPDYLVDGSIFSELEQYKIMTMNHENREPNYVNFDFEVKVIKYDLSRPASETNQIIFDIINNYFKDYVETINFEYFASNLQRRIDGALGDSSGIEVALVNDISISENMYDEFYKLRQYYAIVIRLSMPYENLYEGNGIEFDGAKFLPSIDTEDFTLKRTKYNIYLPHFTFVDGGDPIENSDIQEGQVVRKKIVETPADIAGNQPAVYSPSEFYRALTFIPNVSFLSEDFSNDNVWFPIDNISTDVFAKDTLQVEGTDEVFPDKQGTILYYYANPEIDAVTELPYGVQTDVYLMDQFADGDLALKWNSVYKNISADFTVTHQTHEGDENDYGLVENRQVVIPGEIVQFTWINGPDIGERYYQFISSTNTYDLNNPFTGIAGSAITNGADYLNTSLWLEIIDVEIDIVAGDVIRYVSFIPDNNVEYYIAINNDNIQLINEFINRPIGFDSRWELKIDGIVTEPVNGTNYEIIRGENEKIVQVNLSDIVQVNTYSKGVITPRFYKRILTTGETIDLITEDFNNTERWTFISAKDYEVLLDFDGSKNVNINTGDIVKVVPSNLEAYKTKFYRAETSGVVDLVTADYPDTANWTDITITTETGTNFTVFRGNTETTKIVNISERVKQIKQTDEGDVIKIFERLTTNFNGFLSSEDYTTADWEEVTIIPTYSFNEGDTEQIETIASDTVINKILNNGVDKYYTPLEIVWNPDNDGSLSKDIDITAEDYEDILRWEEITNDAKYEFILNGSQHIYNINQEDTVRIVDISTLVLTDISNGTWTGEIFNDYNKSEITTTFPIDLATTDYTSDWTQLVPEIYALNFGDPIKYISALLEETDYLSRRDLGGAFIPLIAEMMDKVQPYFTDNWLLYTGKYDLLEPQDLYCEREVLVPATTYSKAVYGNYIIPVDLLGGEFTSSSISVELPIYLGNVKDQNPDYDRVVGRYVIRNERFDLIDVELYFDNGVGIEAGSDSSGNPDFVGVPAPSQDKEGIPGFLTFTDYGYGYVDLIYPSNIDSNSDNIPFRDYTIPRLRQVKFDVQ